MPVSVRSTSCHPVNRFFKFQSLCQTSIKFVFHGVKSNHVETECPVYTTGSEQSALVSFEFSSDPAEESLNGALAKVIHISSLP